MFGNGKLYRLEFGFEILKLLFKKDWSKLFITGLELVKEGSYFPDPFVFNTYLLEDLLLEEDFFSYRKLTDNLF